MVCAAGEPTKRGTEQSGRQQSSGSDSSIAAANSDRRGRKPAKKKGRQQNYLVIKVIEWLANRRLKYEIELGFANYLFVNTGGGTKTVIKIAGRLF